MRFLGAWVAQLVKPWVLGLGSGFDHRVVSSKPTLGFTLGVETLLKKKKDTLDDEVLIVKSVF